MLKEVFAPHLNRNVKLGGRQIPVAVGPHMKLENYMRLGTLPPPPPTLNLSALAMACLIQIFGNNALGDCVIAAKQHVDGVWTGNADGGTPYVATEAQVVAQYGAIGGYVAGNPATDQGCNMQTAMNWYVQNPGSDGTKLLAWLGGSPTSITSMMAAVNLTENAYIGMALPDAWISPFPSGNGFVWDVAGDPNPSNGHCIMGLGYTTQGLLVDSWGLLGTLTWGAIAKYCVSNAGGEFYHLLSTDIVGKSLIKSPEGVAWATLLSDWDSLGGNVPVPAPAPAPTPAPTTNPSMAQLIAAATAALQTQAPLIPRPIAERLVVQAITKLFPAAAA